MAEKYDAGSSVQSKLAPPTENQPGGAAKGTATQKFKEKVQFAKAEQYGSRAVGGSVLRIRSCSVCCSVFLGSSHLLLRLPPTCTPFSADLCCSCSVFRWRIFPSCSVCLVFSDAPPLRAGTRRRMRSCTARSSPATTWSPTPSRRRPTSAPSPRRCATAAACTSGSCTAC